jgi:hypothetical protein
MQLCLSGKFERGKLKGKRKKGKGKREKEKGKRGIESVLADAFAEA